MNRLTDLLVFLFFVFTKGENCDNLGINIYEDLACKPVNKGGECPASYDCTLQAPSSDQCVVRGHLYNVGDSIPRTTSRFNCEFGCRCNRPDVSCPQWGCGDWAGVPPLAEGCYRKYDLEACCSTGIVCPPFNDTTTCVVDGVEYKAGERFFPKDSCYACLCQKGFNGKFEAPYCKRSGCDAQVKHQSATQKSCAPLYIKRTGDGDKKCCPREWTCPDGSEVIKSSGKKSDSTCKFGEKIFQIGDSFEKEIQYLFRPLKIKCECKVPPLLICQEG
ncbi:uncharacterized protein [Tenebrio molitor]|uniref:uncharacterized protein n=1 Tax=Tenebrio molitor TaxID=7067 RepID=UPI003624A659